jgi:hypothetical protein
MTCISVRWASHHTVSDRSNYPLLEIGLAVEIDDASEVLSSIPSGSIKRVSNIKSD